MCRVLKVHRSGFYALLQAPSSTRSIEDKRLLSLIRESYDTSDSIYGSTRVFRDLREAGEVCRIHRVASIMKTYKIKAPRGYKKSSFKYGKPLAATPNRLEQDYNVKAPNLVWVPDITYIRTWEGWLYLAVVVDLYSRMVVGWSMKPSFHKDIVLDALLMSVWNRRPDTSVIVHSDQGSQYDSDDW
jgi:putative transposase